MLHKAGGIGTGRSRTASAPDPLHFPINLVSIAATGQLLPSASPTRSNRVKLKFGVVSTQRADFEPETRHHKSSATHPVAPSRTQSHHFSLYPLAFSLFSNPACRAGLSRQSLLAATNAKRTRVKASQSQSKSVKPFSELGRLVELPATTTIYCVSPCTIPQPMVFFPCDGHDGAHLSAIRNPQSAIPLPAPGRSQPRLLNCHPF